MLPKRPHKKRENLVITQDLLDLNISISLLFYAKKTEESMNWRRSMAKSEIRNPKSKIQNGGGLPDRRQLKRILEPAKQATKGWMNLSDALRFLTVELSAA